jgi:ABC-type Fe3+/spermidine/putrescine transport system ATPase subunit
LAGITIEHVSRSFGSVRAIDDVSLAIEQRELFTLLGPSGCGKTTLLRMIAGFTELETGQVRFGDKRIDQLPPHRRNTGMVFQNYAVFPNLTVANNIAYGLRARKLAPAQIGPRVARALRLVRLAGYDDRWPHQLSGGQLQRVAIARALVIEPTVLLLDEPLSNLDAKLRVEMRAELRKLQQTLGITAIYVTHDQEEALSISDRIAVMRGGRFEQVGTPEEIYRRPKTPFVAEFMGTTNLLSGHIHAHCERGSLVEVKGIRFLVPNLPLAPGTAITFSLRPESLLLLAAGEAAPEDSWSLPARVTAIEFLGTLTRVEVLTDPGCPLCSVVLGVQGAGLAVDDDIVLAYEPRQVSVFTS